MNKKLKTLLLLAAFLLPWITQAQGDSLARDIIFRTGTDATRWKTLTANATMPTLSEAESAASGVLSIGFTFKVGESAYTQFSVNTKGHVKLGDVAADPNANAAFSYEAPESYFPVACGASCGYTRMSQNTTSYIKYELQGTQPNRVLVVEFKQHINSSATSGTINYQVQLHEDSNRVVIVYGDTTGTILDYDISGYHIGFGFSTYDIFSILFSSNEGSGCFDGYGNFNSYGLPSAGRYYQMTIPYSDYPRPVLTDITATTDSAYITWRNDGAVSYTFEYATGAFTPGTNTATVINNIVDTTIALENLTHSTLYHYALRGVYADGSSNYRTGTFYTECAAVALPYGYGFEENDSLGQCWTYGRSGFYASESYPSISWFTTTYPDGSNALSASVYNYGIGYANYWAAMPLLATPLNGVQLSFDLKTAHFDPNYSVPDRSPVLVGYMTDVEDFSTFVRVDILDPQISDYTQWEENWNHIVISFPDTTYPANARIAFVLADNGIGSNDMKIDNVEVTQLAACPYVKDIEAQVTAGSALLSWSYESASSRAVPYAYEIRYAPVDDLSNEGTEWPDRTTYELLNLEPNTEYKLYITPQCANGDGQGDTIFFKTLSLPCITPDPTTNDTLIVGEGTALTDKAPIAYYYYYSYEQMLYAANELNGTTIIRSLAMQRPTNVPDFRPTLSGLQIYMGHTPQATLSNDYAPYDSLSLVKIDTNNITIDTNTGWVTFGLDSTFTYNGRDNLVIAFNTHLNSVSNSNAFQFYSSTVENSVRWAGDSYTAFNPATPPSSSPYAERPNIRLVTAGCETSSNCAAPVVAVDSVSDNAARVTWVPGYQETQWDIDYRQQGITEWTNAVDSYYGTETDDGTEHNYIITDLAPGKNYEVRVKTICGSDTLFATAAFTTGCGPIYRTALPYTENFSSLPLDTYGIHPNCWYHDENNSYYPATFPYAVGNRQPVMQLTSESSWDGSEIITSTLILPRSEMRLDSLELLIDMYKRNENQPGKLVIGAMTDPSDATTFTAVDTIQLTETGTWVTVEADLTHTPAGTGRYIAIHSDYAVSGSDDLVFISNVMLAARSTCRPVSALFATNITHESADVMIRDEENIDALGYTAYISTTNDINTASDPVNFYGNVTSFTGLQAETQYYVWVEVQCNDGSISRTRTFSFTTIAPCNEVVDLTATYNAANHTAVLSWNPSTIGIAADKYVVRYAAASNEQVVIDTVQTNYYLINSVLENTTYAYSVTPICDTFVSNANSGSFSTESLCTVVGNFANTWQMLPFYGYYYKGYTQTIYLAEELSNIGDTIYGVHYLFTGTSNNQFKKFDVYMANTELDSFANENSWIIVDSSNLVGTFSGSMPLSGSLYIPFSTPFVRHADSNIVLVLDNNSSTWNRYNPSWYVTNTNSNRSIYINQDDPDINPAAPTSGTLTTYIPNVKFDATCMTTVTCGNPLVVATGADEQSISLRWFAGGTETVWNVDYRLLGDSAWTNYLTNTTDTAATITGLQNGVAYQLRVSDSCNGALYETVIEASTECGLITVPFTEDFELVSTGAFSRNCWTAGTAATGVPTVATHSTLGNVITVDHGAYLTLPTFATDVNALQAHFTYGATEEGSTIQVGVITDPATIETFSPLATITANEANMPNTATVNFDGFSGTSGQICFFQPASLTRGTFYVDNIVIDSIPNCPTVENISLTGATENTATIAWTIMGQGSVSNYMVAYSEVGGTFDSVFTTTTTSTTLQGLNAATTYDVTVTAVCAGGDTTYTSPVLRFTTECGIYSLPYVMDFDMSTLPNVAETHTMPACWFYDMVDINNPYSYYIYPQIGHGFWGVTPQSSPNVLFVRNSAVVAMPDFGMPLDTLKLSFYGGSVYNNDPLVVGTVDSLEPGFAASFVPLDTITGNDASNITMHLCTYGAISGRYLAFFNPGNDVPIYLDDVVVDINRDCMPVSNLACDSATVEMAYLSWTAPCNGTPESYEVEYGPRGFTQGTGTTITSLYNEAAITGLTPGTRYDAYVRAICDSINAGEWRTFSFVTAICEELAETYFFRDTVNPDTTQYIPGRTFEYYSYSQIIIDSAMMADNGYEAGSMVAGFGFFTVSMDDSANFTNSRVLMKNSSKRAFTSSTDFEPMTEADVVFEGDLNWETLGWNNVTFDVAFAWDGHSNVVLAIDRNHGNYGSSFSKKFLAYTDTNVVRGIYQSDDYDNANPFNMTYAGTTTNTVPQIMLYTCAPTCATIVNAVESTTYSTATISWRGEAVNYEVNVKPVADANWPATDIAVNGATTYTFTGLMPATRYQFRVRGLCEEEVTGEWTEGTFTTDSLYCYTPTNLAAEATFGAAEMTWTNGGDETEWTIHVWNGNFNQNYEATANPFSVTGLQSGTTYQAAIAAVCGEGIMTGEYSDTITFTTDSCDRVTNVVATVNGTTATVTWTPGENNNGNFLVEYGLKDFAAGEGTTLTATTNSVEITGLDTETEYEVVVRAICDGQYNSGWSARTEFTTGVGINTVEGNSMVSIYPNPAENNTTISVSGVEGNVTVTIVDMNGRTVSTTTMECAGDCEKMMNVDGLASGSYFVRLQGNGFNAVKKLIIK